MHSVYSFPFTHFVHFGSFPACTRLFLLLPSFHSLIIRPSSLRLLVHIRPFVTLPSFHSLISLTTSVHSTHSSLLLVHSIHDSSFISFVRSPFYRGETADGAAAGLGRRPKALRLRSYHTLLDRSKSTDCRYFEVKTLPLGIRSIRTPSLTDTGRETSTTYA